MKTTQRLRLAGSALLIALSTHAYAQSAASAPAAMPAASGPTAAAKAQYHASKAQYNAAKAANRALAKKVRNALVADSTISASNLTVRAHDGAVTLQGSVPEAPQSDRATEVAKGVAGVKSVKNALSIHPAGA
ncbi:Osmotically-inducible protein Y [Paraburkholderia nemoris]|uniref:BON domain-containing protein n=1 Tax=Paraburkholderia nemoris TaxID=2793076 RepID=UPI00190A7C7A|nr:MULTISPECIES: BON domain-containing protein [Paraburkholderia]MBK3786991.1 BON domain-containing protein [Paraburkholderia aspalathi]MBK3787088.1 BON domain-containing protein [Paraburkholderia aspalathi]CAE6845511.1 Osmotically-inducible protein Y [Paraburkholderia nemoris]CAE6862460.1 Osmotically-inducible protein Y [Paraburkholderia nemoris]